MRAPRQRRTPVTFVDRLPELSKPTFCWAVRDEPE
jgi:hypothetical protein